MAETVIKISYSPNYASGFTNVSLNFAQLVAFLGKGYRFYHYFNEKAIRSSVSALNYTGRSDCYDFLCKLKWSNQFTSDLITRKVFRPFEWFQYIVVDVLQSPYSSLNAMLTEIEVKPNIVSVVNNKAYRLFYILSEVQPLTMYSETYYSIVNTFDGAGWILSDLSTPKVIRGNKSVIYNTELINGQRIVPLF